MAKNAQIIAIFWPLMNKHLYWMNTLECENNSKTFSHLRDKEYDSAYSTVGFANWS